MADENYKYHGECDWHVLKEDKSNCGDRKNIHHIRLVAKTLSCRVYELFIVHKNMITTLKAIPVT